MARNPGTCTLLERGFCLAVLSALCLTAQVSGQLIDAEEEAKTAAAEDAAENVFLPADRQTLQKLADAKKLLRDGRYGEAVRCLGVILEGPEDFFFQPDKNSPIHRSLKAEAHRLVGQMSRQGRELYELQYGARARRMLADALESGDLTALADVSRRFFHTQSGYQATYLLGLNHFDRGRPLAGALTLQRLREPGVNAEDLEPGLSLTLAACWLQAGMRDKAQEVLVSLRQRRPTLRVAVAGREVTIFSNDAEAINWLSGLVGAAAIANPVETDRWLMYRGDPARNAVSAGSSPLLNMQWRVPVTDDPMLETFLDQFQRQSMEQSVPLLPTLHPLAVADVLLMRTAKNLQAVDFASGKRLWEVPEEDVAESTPGVPSIDAQTRQSLMISGTGQRLWGDLTYGTLSSDGRLVFSVEDLDTTSMGGGASVLRLGGVIRVGGIVNGEQATSPCNRLAAYDIRTGKLKWHIGGRAGQHALRQADTYFLGVPLPLQGQLYVLAEVKGEVRLLVLEGVSGDLLWSQQLAVVEQGLAQDPLRRGAGVSPSYTDGILVCPTATGAIVGVELASRSLLWGYRYGQGRNYRTNGIPVFIGGINQQRWADSSVLIVDGRVLVTPVESDFLYCLNLIDGKELWKSSRHNDLYVACADRERVVLVGRRAVHALRMTDGKPAWSGRSVELPENSTPSGRGFLAANRYYLPLSSAQVAGIDVTEGKIAHISKSRKGDIPGNLICYQGKVISQSSDGVDAFYQLDAVAADVKRRLATNPNDAEALSLLGETQLDADNRSEAVASFQRAYETVPTPRTRELLRDALLDGLRTDFAAYRTRIGELERLADNVEQKADYMRLMAGGLRHAGELTAAFDYYQKLMDLQPNRLELDRIDQTLSVRRDRWFQSQLALLRSEAKDDAAAKIDAAVKSQLDAALAAGSIDALQRFLDYYGNQPTATQARSELIRRLWSAGQLLEAELTAFSGPNNAETVIHSATQEVSRQRSKNQEASWPVGKVEITTVSSTTASANAYRRYAIDMRGNVEPYFSDTTLHFDDARHLIFGNDGWGRQQWQISLAAEGQRQNFAYNRAWTHARAEGHLLLVMLGTKIIAIDTFGRGRNGAAHMLWAQDLVGADQAAVRSPLFANLLPWQLQNQMAQLNDRNNLVGPITSRYICFQRFRNVVAVDPVNGSPLWVRQNIAPGSDLFGDDQYLFVLSPDREDALLLRASDGEQLGTRKVPRVSGRQVLPTGEEKTIYARLEESCLAMLGRQLLLWWQDGTGRTLTLVDPLEGRDVWPGRKFSHAARAYVVRDEAVGVFEPDGRFVLLGLPDGRTIAEAKLQAEPTLIDISIEVDGGRYFLITHSSAPERNGVNIQPLIGSDPKPINTGRLYAFDKQGKALWPEPVVLQNQFLLADQPVRVPILTFACQVYEQNGNGGRQKMVVRCIDKRNGRTVFKADYPNQNNIFEVAGNNDKKTVDLVLQQQTVRLAFTDKPLPPPSPTDGEITKKPRSSKGSGDFWNSVQKVFGDLMGDTEQKKKK